MLRLYTFGFYLALPFIFLKLWLRSKKNPAYKLRLKERLGFTPINLDDKCIWIHAVSLGETIAAIPLIEKIQKEFVSTPIVMTHMTPTGFNYAKKILNGTVLQSYIPYDIPAFLNLFIQKINPKCLIVVETELWPNLFSVCNKKNIPIMVFNARLSEKSAKGYHLVSSVTKKILKSISILSAQSKEDAERFKKLGMLNDKIHVTGNVKFDITPSENVNNITIARDVNFIWIAASTHEGEEEIILAAHKLVLDVLPNSLLLLAPRHPERFDSVLKLILKNHVNVGVRSKTNNITSEMQIYLCDTIGELMLFYSFAQVAFVGGSLIPIGGHNMLEPAALGKPILSGKYLFNFKEISELLLKKNALNIVNNAEELANKIIVFFKDENLRNSTGNNAKEVVMENKGAIDKNFELVKKIIMKV